MKKKTSTNKSFGITFFIFFVIISAYTWANNNKEISIIFLVLSALFLILGLLNSSFLAPLNKFWMKFGLFLSKIVNPIILFIIYYAVVFPTSLLLKVLKKDILDLNIDKQKKSYWVNKKNTSDMKNQF
jgi:predicted membrane protein